MIFNYSCAVQDREWFTVDEWKLYDDEPFIDHLKSPPFFINQGTRI